jgi:hypothetical protein
MALKPTQANRPFMKPVALGQLAQHVDRAAVDRAEVADILGMRTADMELNTR